MNDPRSQKASDALRTIGEMAAELDIKPHILRYWETQFPMLVPLKRAGGRRHYRPDDAALLRLIHRLLTVEGYTIRGARKFVEDMRAPRGDGVAGGSTDMPAHVDNDTQPFLLLPDRAGPQDGGSGMTAAQRARLRAIRDRLAAALAG